MISLPAAFAVDHFLPVTANSYSNIFFCEKRSVARNGSAGVFVRCVSECESFADPR